MIITYPLLYPIKKIKNYSLINSNYNTEFILYKPKLVSKVRLKKKNYFVKFSNPFFEDSYKVILNEIKNINTINSCDNIIPILDFGLDEININNANIKLNFFITSYMDSNLKEAIFSYKTLHKFILDISSFLTQIHSLGYIYNDLKPDNIMYSNEEKLFKVIDFGSIRKHSNNNNKLYNIYAKYERSIYSSKSKLLCKNYSYETDWYALGVILSEIIYDIDYFTKLILPVNIKYKEKIKLNASQRIWLIEFISILLSENVDDNEVINKLSKI